MLVHHEWEKPNGRVRTLAIAFAKHEQGSRAKNVNRNGITTQRQVTTCKTKRSDGAIASRPLNPFRRYWEIMRPQSLLCTDAILLCFALGHLHTFVFILASLPWARETRERSAYTYNHLPEEIESICNGSVEIARHNCSELHVFVASLFLFKLSNFFRNNIVERFFAFLFFSFCR